MNLKFYSCIILALCLSFSSFAQCNGTITLSSQAEVDAFPSTYGCSNIPGTLQIIDTNDVTNLDSLYQLTSVGTLTIERNALLADIGGLSNLTSTNSLSFTFNPEITNVNAFSSLVSVGVLNISDDPKLTNLDGFSSLRSANTINIQNMETLISIQGLSGLTTLDAPGRIRIIGNAALTSLAGTENFSSIPGHVFVGSNNAMTTLDGFTALTYVGGLNISGHANLTTVPGFASLQTVGNASCDCTDPGLSIAANPKLANVDGFSSLQTVTNNLEIVANALLTNVDGFSQLTSIGRMLLVGSNASLSNLDGLSALTSVGVNVGYNGDQSIDIERNPALTSIRGLRNVGAISGALTILQDSSLVSLDGLQKITHVGGRGVEISENKILVDTDALGALTTIDGNLYIKNNLSLTNLNGFRSLTSTTGFKNVGYIEISGNQSLQNVDSLSSLMSMGGTDKYLYLYSNPKLTKACGLYPLLQYGMGCPPGVSCAHVTINGNGPGVTEQSIRNGGPCQGVRQCNGPISLTSQAEVDAFPSTYGCSNITGTLEIRNTSDVTNLDSLYQLTSIGTLTIESNAQLVDLAGLSNLTSTHSLSVAFNPEIANVNGFSALMSAGSLTITDNPKLTNLDGFSSLTSANTTTIQNNAALISIQGLSGLTTVDAPGDFRIISNAALISLAGMENISSIPGELRVIGNDALTNLGGFSALTQAGGLLISGNANLTVLPGFENLKTVSGASCECPEPGLRLLNNARLTNVDGFSSLKSVTYNIEIINNPLLAHVDGFSHLTSVGRMLQLVSNSSLANLDGLSALTSVGVNTGFGDQSIDIERNSALTSINGLRNVPSIPGGLTIAENTSLQNLDGLEKIERIGGTGTNIVGNTALTQIDGLRSVAFVAGNLYIQNNTSLINLNGFASLTSTGGNGPEGRIEISGNSALENVDSLSSLTSMGGADKYLVVTNNPNLTNACGLYPLIHNNLGCPPEYSCHHITISGNGAGVTEQSIREQGPCGGVDPENPPQPTNLSFSKITGVTMRLSFTPADQAPSGGYLILMRHDEAPYPEEGPVEGTPYQVGDVIGNSTIVVGTDLETTSDIVGLQPNTQYYFAVFSYTASYHYVIPDYLHDDRVTGDPEPPRTNTLVFSNVTDNTMTVSFTADSTADGYITVMRANYSSFPDEVPEDGVVYSVGNVIGHSTIVVGVGSEESNDIVWLESDVDYFFEVLRYDITNGYYDYDAENPQSGHQRTNSSSMMAAYPNPFTDNITIPFKVREENTHVSIVIFDQLGRVVSEVTNKRFDPGDHEVIWDRNDLQGKRVIEGLYMYAVKSSEKNRSAQGMVVAK